MTTTKKEYPWEKHYPKNIKWNSNIPVGSLYSILDNSAAKYPDNVCIDYYGKKYTYAEVLDTCNRIAKGLQENGVSKGTKVGIFMPNCPQFIFAYFGILKAGGIVVNYNPLYTIHELVHQVQDSDTKIMMTIDLTVLYEKTSNLLQTTPLDKVIVFNFKEALPLHKGLIFSWTKGSEIASVSFGRINISADDLLDNDGRYKDPKIVPEKDSAVLQYTGGTTGVPKGAILTHANLYANVVQTGMWFDGLEEGNERMLGILPFFHVFAMTVVMNLSVYKACEIFIHSRFDINAVLKDINKKRITLLPGVPTLFAAINNFVRNKKTDISSLKFCFSGGAPLPLEIRKTFEEITGCKLVEGYGLSETSPVAVANPLFGVNKEGSIGIPLPGTIVEIRDMEGKNSLMPKDKVGEVCITGPQVMQGYYNNESETNNVLQGKRLHTGDLGYMDEEGYIFIVDRLKDMIICNGFNVYPREIEEELYKHTSIEEVAVVGVLNDYKGQDVKAFIKLRLGEELTADRVVDFLRGKLAKYKLPTQVEFVNELPKTIIGKVSKKNLVKNEKKVDNHNLSKDMKKTEKKSQSKSKAVKSSSKKGVAKAKGNNVKKKTKNSK